MRKTIAVALRTLKLKGVRSMAVALDGEYRRDDFASAAVEGALVGDFEPDQYKTDPSEKEKHLDELVICGGSEGAVRRGRVLGESQNFTRSLANEPPNILTPIALAGRARQLASEQGLDCEVLDQD